MASKARARKVATRIQEELAGLLQREVADPRLELITVTGVDLDRELAVATVYVSAVAAAHARGEVLKALAGARGYLRHELAARIQLRTFPELRFRWDASADRGARIEELLKEIHPEGGEVEGG